MENSIKVVIVDDHKLFRMTLRNSLYHHKEITILGEAESGAELFELLNQVSCDILLLDLILPDMGIFEIYKRLRKEFPAMKILVISADNTFETLCGLLELGINGFISKQAGGVDEVFHAISSIAAGYEYFGSDISKMIYNIFVSKTDDKEAQIPEFTPREKEILTLCSQGFLAKEIAEKLFISVNTVNNHKNNMFKKLGINSTMEMVHYALKHKIIRA
ncbi:MAG: response regulator transcription factor [Marinilabiliaceae bacterium]|nr:response regulator transcription factor [Marinilabiliaceae bacterium]